MRLLLDVDGVCADMIGHLLEETGTDISYADVTSWNLHTVMPAKEYRHARSLMRDPRFWWNLPAIEGAERHIRNLAGRVELTFVTAPYWECRDWVHTRREWLECYFTGRTYGYIPTEAKHLVRGDVFIDDKPENIINWAACNPEGRAILFRQPWNAYFMWPEAIHEWSYDTERFILKGPK